MNSINFGDTEEHNSLYDILELTPDATPQEIRSAYLRLKNAYSKDNVAHYSLFSVEESESTLQKIESAYLILSNPEKRKSYDATQGHASSSSPLLSSGDTLEASPTPASFASMGYGLVSSPSTDSAPASEPVFSTNFNTPTSTHVDAEWLIQNEQDYDGSFIRKVREAKRITLEDLADYTRISRVYLQALEQEEFAKLPALVYTRGFLQQVAKRLKIPFEPLIAKYLERYKAARPEKL